MSWKKTIKEAEPETKEQAPSGWRDTITDAPEQIPAAASAIQGAAAGASADFLDEIAGGLEAAGSTVGLRGLGGSFKDLRLETDEEDKQSLSDIYAQARDAKRQALKESAKQNPVAFGGGKLTGGVALGLATPINPATVKGATALGAGTGAVQAVGASESQSKLEMIKEALEGGALGGLFGAGAGGVAKALKPASKVAGDQASRSAYRTTGGLKTDINKLYNMTPDDVGRELLDRKLIKVGTRRGSEKLAERVQKEIADFSSGQEKLIKGLDKVKPKSFDVSKAVQGIRAQADEFASMAGSGNQAYAKALTKEADIITENYLKKGKRFIDLDEALSLKRAFDQGGKFQSPLSEASSVEAARSARGLLKRQIDDTVETIAGPQVSQAYEQTRQGASRLLSAKNALEQAKARDTANKTFGLTDMLGGAAGATAGAVAGGPAAVAGLAAGVATNKLISNFGASTTAVMLDKASKMLASEGLEQATRKLGAIYGADVANEILSATRENADPRKQAVYDYLKQGR